LEAPLFFDVAASGGQQRREGIVPLRRHWTRDSHWPGPGKRPAEGVNWTLM